MMLRGKWVTAAARLWRKYNWNIFNNLGKGNKQPLTPSIKLTISAKKYFLSTTKSPFLADPGIYRKYFLKRRRQLFFFFLSIKIIKVSLLHPWSLHLCCSVRSKRPLNTFKYYLDSLGCSIYHFIQMDIQPLKADTVPVPYQLPGSAVWQSGALKLLHIFYVSKADQCQQLEPVQTVMPRPTTWLIAGVEAM